MKRGSWAGNYTVRFSLGRLWFGWNLKNGRFFWLVRTRVHYGDLPSWPWLNKALRKITPA